MTTLEHPHRLARAAALRREATRLRAAAAIEKLDDNDGDVTFASVAEAAGVSRAWLYREADFREAIVSLRSARSPSPLPPAAQRASVDSLHQRLDALRADIAALRAENVELRSQLAHQFGTQRALHGAMINR
jgi:ribosomal protein L29